MHGSATGTRRRRPPAASTDVGDDEAVQRAGFGTNAVGSDQHRPRRRSYRFGHGSIYRQDAANSTRTRCPWRTDTVTGRSPGAESR